MSKNVDVVEKAFELSDDEEEEPSTLPVEKDDTKETILQTSLLFIRNLSFSCTDEELADLFKTLWRNISGEFLVISLLYQGFFFVQNFQDDKTNRDIRLFHREC